MPHQANLAQSGTTTVIDAPVLAHALRQTLDLRHEPVALSFVPQQPAGNDVFSDTVPSACTSGAARNGKPFSPATKPTTTVPSVR
jgi:hypothetical protein